jgi:hypothetical protein
LAGSDFSRRLGQNWIGGYGSAVGPDLAVPEQQSWSGLPIGPSSFFDECATVYFRPSPLPQKAPDRIGRGNRETKAEPDRYRNG